MMKNKAKEIIRKVSYIFLVLAIFFSYSSLIPVTYALSDEVHYDTVSSADPSTASIESMLSGEMEDDGKVVADKSVINISEDEFEIQLSALGQSYPVADTVETGKLLDVVFILDVSGSMENGSPTRYRNMTRAVNSAMRTISNANSENRMGIVTFNGGYDVLLELDSYTTTRDSCSSLDNINEDSFIKASNAEIGVSTDYIKSCDGESISSKSVVVNGGTYTQLGIAKGAQMLLNLSEDDKVDRVPVIILLSDGKPTYYSENIENPTAGNKKGDGNSTSATIGLNTIKTAVVFKNKVTASYTAANNESDMVVNTKFYTIAMDLGENSNFEKMVLNPSDANISTLNSTGMEGQVKAELSKMTDYNYADKGYSGDMSGEELLRVFNEIATQLVSSHVSPISVMSEYTDNRVLSFNDTLGTGMEVKSAPKVSYNGTQYLATSFNKESNYTQYFYNYAITKDDGDVVNLNELVVKIYINDNHQQEIIFGISTDLFPYITIDENKEIVRELPIRLITKVGLTAETVNSAKTNDVFYTNDWTDSKTTATYMPAGGNIYYYENIEYAEDGTVLSSDVKYKDESIIKSENTTGTSATSLETNFNQGTVVATLGNNGKVTLVDPTEIVDKTVTKVWNDNDDQDGIRPETIEVQLVMNGNDTDKKVILNESNEWTATFNNLKKYTNGAEIVYTVKEITEVDGYETTYSEDTFTIVNNHRILTITKSVDNEQANPGDALTYTIIVSNNGDCVAKDVVVTDILDSNLEFVSSDGIYDEETRVVTYTIPAIRPNEKVEFKIVVYVKDVAVKDTVIKNTAVILGDENNEVVTSNEVTTLVEESSISEVVLNPDTSDNIYIVYITLISNMLLLGFFVLRKIKV